MYVPFVQSAGLLSATAKSSAESNNQSVIILITGFTVVFLVLLLLIGIIKLYSGIVYAAQKKAERKQTAKTEKIPEIAPAVAVVQEVEPDDTLDLQTVAVITAAVEAYYSKDKKVRITSIRPANKSRSEWASAGLVHNIPAMRSEGLL